MKVLEYMYYINCLKIGRNNILKEFIKIIQDTNYFKLILIYLLSPWLVKPKN